MMFATWLEGLICPAVATHATVKKEKKENVLRFKLGKKKFWNWVAITLTVGSNC
jgi:hypothetical protein